jgi:hypothetical protein
VPELVRGLPAHVLLIHAVVVLVPLTAFLLVAAAVLPAARARLGVFLPLLAAGCLVLVPLTVHAGGQLRELVGSNPLIERHAHLGRQLLPWTAALLVLSLVVWWRGRTTDPDRADAGELRRDRRLARTEGAAPAGGLVHIAVAVVCLVVAVGTVVQVVRVGESGSKAVWSGVVSSQ